MEASRLFQGSFIAVAVFFAATQVSADVVETKSGARLVGRVLKIDDSFVVLKTDFSDDIKVKQSEVTSVTTEAPLVVRLSSGTVLEGTLSSSGQGGLVITGADGSVTTRVDKVATTWAHGGIDPAIVALQRVWTYEATVDVSGKTGNKEQLATAFGARATMKTPQDTLLFYTAYDRQVSDGTKSADQFKAGVDYTNNFSGRKSWYVRDEGGFDRIKDIDLYNTAGVGVGYDFIKKPKHVLTLRAGLSYRYEGYKNPATTDVNAAGLDFGLNHRYEGKTWSLVNRLSYVPLIKEYGNYRLQHESFFEIPMANPEWKLRVGLTNDYNSHPGILVEKLDTTYFTRLVLSWK
jgi:putative salt-induced outer membrane protein YdiY